MPDGLAGSGGYVVRAEVPVGETLVDQGVRPPRVRCEALIRRARREGVEVPGSLLAGWRAALA